MSTESVERFYAALADNDQMRKACFDTVAKAWANAVSAFAADQGFVFSPEDLTEVVASQAAEIGDDELAAIQGGTSFRDPTSLLGKKKAGRPIPGDVLGGLLMNPLFKR